MVYLPLRFSLFLVSWKNLIKDKNSQNLACVCPFLSEVWHFRFLTLSPLRLEIAVCPIFEPPIYLCNKGYPNFCDMRSKAVPKYSSFVIFRVWVVVVAMCHTHQKMEEVAFWSYIDSSISWNWFGDVKLFLLQQLEGSNAFQMSRKNKQKFHSVWDSNYLEINFLYFLTAQTPWFLYATKVCALGINWKMCASVYITPYTFQMLGVLGAFQEICH